jgi:hypothetical protein
MIQRKNPVQDLLKAMAYNREQFKDRVEEKVGGALLEYYKAALASLHQQTRWVEHWQSEVDRLIDTELVVVLLHSIKGFKDRKKAAQEVIEHLHGIDERYRRAAGRIVKRDYGLKRPAAPIPEEIAEQFYQRVEETIEAHT